MNKKTDVEVNEKLVKEIASLARLDLTEKETKMFVSQFRDILDYVGVLDEVNTENVPPAYSSLSSINRAREDQIEDSVPTNEFLANAPQAKEDYVLIPRVHVEK